MEPIFSTSSSYGSFLFLDPYGDSYVIGDAKSQASLEYPNMIACNMNNTNNSQKKQRKNYSPTQVNILRNWIITHYYHPYPNENEKIFYYSFSSNTSQNALMKQTGLEEYQMSQWFWNQRHRYVSRLSKQEYVQKITKGFKTHKIFNNTNTEVEIAKLTEIM